MTAETFTRPNGKTYRPRSPKLVAHAWEDTHYVDLEQGVIIFGTLDPDKAQAFASEMCNYWFHTRVVDDPQPGWYRNTFRDGRLTWIEDSDRGRPGVMFTAVHA